MLLIQLEARFGQVPDWVYAKLEGAKEDQFFAWGRKVLFADSLGAVFD